MSEVQMQLRAAGSVVLDGNGNGSITLDPDHANQRWEVRAVSVTSSQAATSTPVPVATLYRNIVDAGHSQGASWSGSLDSWQGLVRIGPMDALLIVFAGGIPGTVLTATVEGDKYSRKD